MSHTQVWPHFDANKSIWLFYSVNVTHCKLRFQIFCLVGNFLQYFTISKISLTFEIFSLIENIFILQSLVYPRLAHCDLEAVLLRRSYSSINLNFCFNFIQFLCCDLRAVLLVKAIQTNILIWNLEFVKAIQT